MGGKITISNVAERAGVAKSTISHALNGKRPVSQNVRKKVFSAISELGYKPSFAARTLKGEKTMVIGGLFDNIQFGGGLPAQLLSDNFRKHGYIFSTWLCATREEAFRTMRMLSCGIVDSVINALPSVSVHEAVCSCQPVPTTTFLRNYEDSPVILDIKTPYYEALDYLWRLGHRHIGFMHDLKAEGPGEENSRIAAYKTFMEARGCYDPVFCKTSNISTRSGFESGIALAPVFHELKCSAIMCSGDMDALGVISWAEKNGLNVPGDISVIGQEDHPFATLSTPSLTTLQPPLEEIVKITVDSIIAKLEPVPRIYTPKPIPLYKLIVRDSTGPAKQI